MRGRIGLWGALPFKEQIQEKVLKRRLRHVD